MPIRPCPQCSSDTPRKLDEASLHAHVAYYRCNRCGHVWTVSKDGKETIWHVTPFSDSENKKP